MPKELIVFMDCGDTIADESTQVFASNGDVLRAEAIPGAVETLGELSREGYRLALVADGRVKSFHNILSGLHIEHLFEARIMSEAIGAEKPDARMFEAALLAMGLGAPDAGRVVMIGNNIERDIAGANRMGITSVLLSYSPRYRMQPRNADETPDYVIAMPRELPGLLSHLELQAKNRRILTQER